jgi:hypothetical protein
VQVGLPLAVGKPLGQRRRWRVGVLGGAAVGDHLAQRAAPPLARTWLAGGRQQLVGVGQPDQPNRAAAGQPDGRAAASGHPQRSWSLPRPPP